MIHKRIQWLDFAKGFTIFCVLIGHSLDVANLNKFFGMDIIWTFIMPVFFAISGYLFKGFKSFSLIIYKKITSFVIPFILSLLLISLFHKFSLGWGGVNGKSFIKVFILYSTGNVKYLTYAWFLYSLFLIFVIVSILYLCNVKLNIQFSLSILCFISCLLLAHLKIISGGCGLKNTLTFMPCFYLGIYMRFILNKYGRTKILRNKNLSIILMLLWIVSVLLIENIKNYQFNMMNISDSLIKLISIPIFFLFFINFYKCIFPKYFIKYGKYTLVIYLIQVPVLIVLKIFMYSIFKSQIILFILLLIISWNVSLLVCYLSNHFKIVNFVFYPRKYINKLVIKTKWGRKLLKQSYL